MDKKNIYSSLVGASVAEIITLPICTIKTVYQTEKFKNALQTTKHIYETRGIRGFYQASTPAIFSQIVSTSSKYTFYHMFKNWRQTGQADLLNNSINGAMGGVCGSIFAHPFDVWKNFNQRDASIYPEFQKDGVKLFYRGYTQNFTKNIMLYSMLYPLYDFFRSQNLNPIQSSVCTSLTTTLILQPIDLLKTRRIADKPLFMGWNPRFYYRGFFLNLARVIPHFCISMSIVEVLKKWT